MKLPQLSLRDLFWLVALVAMGLAWWVREQQLRHEMLVQARISSFFAGELMNQEYLIDWEKESVLLTVPKALQDRVRKSYIRLELGEPVSSKPYRQFEHDVYESDLPPEVPRK